MAEKATAQNKLIAVLERDYGKGIVALGSDEARLKIDRIPTEIFPLDFITRGGIPAEQVTILRGGEGGTKTTTAQIIVARWLALCSDCLVKCTCKKDKKKQRNVLWLDAEGKYPKETQDKLGYDRDRIMITSPETAEESIDIVKDSLYDPAVGLLVIDSVAALCPKIEIEKDAEEGTVGVVAREMNRMWRVIGAARKARKLKGRAPTVIVINQERLKVGMCFDYWTRVLLADGSTKFIGEIVNKKIKASVKTVADGLVMESRIVNWFKRRAPATLSFLVRTGGQRIGFRCTDSHPILTPRGYIKASVLSAGDQILSLAYTELKNKVGIIVGMLLGDGHIRGAAGLSSAFMMSHCLAQEKYLDYKVRLLGIDGVKGRGDFIRWGSKFDYFFGEIRRQVYDGGEIKAYKRSGRTSMRYSTIKAKKRFNSWVEFNLDTLGLTLWYLDDGSFIEDARSNKIRSTICVRGFCREDQERMIRFFNGKGYDCWLMKRGSIVMSRDGTQHFTNDIKSYVPPCMQYKLPEEYRGFFIEPKLETKKDQMIVPAQILKIARNTRLLQRSKFVYDIEVERSHNFIIGGRTGVIVHNSYGDPRVMTGGEGQKFNCALMLRMGARTLKDDKEERPLIEVSAEVAKHNFGPKGKSCKYLLAMSATGNLKALEADDSEFLNAAAGRFGLIKRDGAKWEIMNGSGKPLVSVPRIEAIAALLQERGEIYHKLKSAMMQKLQNGSAEV